MVSPAPAKIANRVELCEACGCNRVALAEMLKDPPERVIGWMGKVYLVESENRTMALHLISGCDLCREHFAEVN